MVANDVIRLADLVTAGSGYDASALRPWAQAATGSIFDVFLGTHDIIVVDTSPVLPVADALLVGRHVDATAPGTGGEPAT